MATTWINSLLVIILLLNLFALTTSRISAVIRTVTLQGIILGLMPLLVHEAGTVSGQQPAVGQVPGRESHSVAIADPLRVLPDHLGQVGVVQLFQDKGPQLGVVGEGSQALGLAQVVEEGAHRH